MAGDKKGNNHAELDTVLKGAFPEMTQQQRNGVLRECDFDAAKLNSWIDSNFEARDQWQVAGKGAKKKGQQGAPAQPTADDAKGKGPAKATASKGRKESEAPRKPLGRSLEGTPFSVPKAKHPAIIGQGGKTIQSLNKEFDVKINVPDRETGLSLIYVAGEPAAVESVRRRLEELLHISVEQAEAGFATLDFPKRLPFLNIKDSFISGVMKDRQVHIHVANKDGGAQVSIEGRVTDVEQARQEIQERYEQESLEAFKVPDGPQPSAPRSGNVPILFVSNLSPSTTAESLKQHFSTAGTVVEVFLEGAGLGRVTFDNTQSAKRALAQKNESELHGHVLIVRRDPPQVTRREETGSRLLPSFANGHHSEPAEDIFVQSNSEVDIAASRTADEIIQKLTAEKDFNIQNMLVNMPLPMANTVQLLMRQRLRQHLNQQQLKCSELDAKHVDDVKRAEQVKTELETKSNLHAKLNAEIQLLQQRLSMAEMELNQLAQEDLSLKEKLQHANQAKAAELQIAERLRQAQFTADTAARGVTQAWSQWLSKLSSNNFHDWTQGDMNTLLHCLGIDSQLFVHNGIEPSMLSCLDDAVLRELSWNDRRLEFGDRRYLLISLHALVSEKRPPLNVSTGHLPSVRDVVTYLMCCGLGINEIPHERHLVHWTVADVASHFRSRGLPSAASACDQQRVCGAVIITMAQKDMMNFKLGSFGEAVLMLHEITRLKTGTELPQPAGKAGIVFKWSVSDVVRYFKDQNIPDLADVCEREKISGPVLLHVKRMDDLQQVEFAKPGDRIRMVQVCQQLAQA